MPRKRPRQQRSRVLVASVREACLRILDDEGAALLTTNRIAEVAGVAIVSYTGLIYAVSIGWIIFGEAQGPLAIVGMLLVVLGVVLSVMYGRRKSRIEEIEATAA